MTTAVAGPPGGDGPGGPERPGRWLLAPPVTSWLPCRGAHPPGGGTLDERDRRLSHEELGVAELFRADGHAVRSLAESHRGGRRPDLEVCGHPVEVKSFLPLEQRGRAPTPYSVFNKLIDASGQAGAVVLYGRGSGLTDATVSSGLARLAGCGRAPDLSVVRAVGDGFDLSWLRRPGLGHHLGEPRRSPRDRPGDLGL